MNKNHICKIEKLEKIYKNFNIKNYNCAIIDCVYYDEGCIYSDMKDEYKSGGTILKIALKLIDKVKEKYKLGYIRLQDNSYKQCYNVK
jgi:hypothetical protein